MWARKGIVLWKEKNYLTLQRPDCPIFKLQEDRMFQAICLRCQPESESVRKFPTRGLFPSLMAMSYKEGIPNLTSMGPGVTRGRSEIEWRAGV